MESLILHALNIPPIFLYFIAFISIIFEANTILFSVAFLTDHGVFELRYIVPVVFFASIIGSLIWYYIGYLSSIRQTIFSRIMCTFSEPVSEHLEKYTLQTLFLTKFIYGLNCATIMKAGQIRMNLMQFIKYEIISTIGWIFIVGLLGYVSGDAYRIVAKYFKYSEIGLLIAIVLFILLKKIVTKYAKKEIES